MSEALLIERVAADAVATPRPEAFHGDLRGELRGDRHDALLARTVLHLCTASEPGDAPEGSELAAVDDRARRREHLLHALAMERRRSRRRRPA